MYLLFFPIYSCIIIIGAEVQFYFSCIHLYHDIPMLGLSCRDLDLYPSDGTSVYIDLDFNSERDSYYIGICNLLIFHIRYTCLLPIIYVSAYINMCVCVCVFVTNPFCINYLNPSPLHLYCSRPIFSNIYSSFTSPFNVPLMKIASVTHSLHC